jgi:hypothetical protein
MMLLPNGVTSEHNSGLSRRELVKYGAAAAVATVVQPNTTVAQSRTVSGIFYENLSGGGVTAGHQVTPALPAFWCRMATRR